jgi:predicted phage terminase large subunit-like protein
MSTSSISPQAAARELLRRRRARASLVAYANAIEVPGKPASDEPDEWLFQPIETSVTAHHRLLLEAIERTAARRHGRLMVFMPPGSAKSTYTSVVAPTYLMGKHPGYRIILASYGSDLARRHGRRARQICRQSGYSAIFGAGIAADTSAADEWALTNGSEYLAGGILSGITGNRANGLLIDDPVKGREDADSEVIRKKTREAFDDDLMTRLIPGGWVVLVQCMTGDTPVLMSDGTERQLRDVRPGDEIASYSDGRLIVATVKNWANQGPDSVFRIKTSSGTIVRANERHPFLIDREGKREWVRLKNLKIGDQILRASIGENGEALPAPRKDATCRQGQEGSAIRTTTNTFGPLGIVLHLLERIRLRASAQSSSIDTGSRSMTTGRFSRAKAASALFVSALRSNLETRSTGTTSCASITATIRTRFVGCSATTATSRSDAERPPRFLRPLRHTCEFIPDAIVEIEPCGRENVFDIEVAGTENFIANGLVSHNTRWHEADLAGGILPEKYDGRSGMIECRDGQTWEVLCLPAQAERADDPLGRAPGEMLWPEWFDERHWQNFRSNPRTWSSLYQQRPAPDSGGYFETTKIARYGIAPRGMVVIGASDYAVTEDGGDYTEHGVIGVDHESRWYLLDWWREQAQSDVWIERQIDLIDKWRPAVWFGESGVIRRAVEPFLLKRMQQRGVPCWLEWLASINDKPTRARSLQALVAMGWLSVPEGKPWVPALIDQLLAFPAGAFDDGVDVLSLAARGMQKFGRGLAPVRPKERSAPPALGVVPARVLDAPVERPRSRYKA